MTLSELKKENLKIFFSARTKALLNFRNNIQYKQIAINKIPKMIGKYQNEIGKPVHKNISCDLTL